MGLFPLQYNLENADKIKKLSVSITISKNLNYVALSLEPGDR